MARNRRTPHSAVSRRPAVGRDGASSSGTWSGSTAEAAPRCRPRRPGVQHPHARLRPSLRRDLRRRHVTASSYAATASPPRIGAMLSSFGGSGADSARRPRSSAPSVRADQLRDEAASVPSTRPRGAGLHAGDLGRDRSRGACRYDARSDRRSLRSALGLSADPFISVATMRRWREMSSSANRASSAASAARARAFSTSASSVTGRPSRERSRSPTRRCRTPRDRAQDAGISPGACPRSDDLHRSCGRIATSPSRLPRSALGHPMATRRTECGAPETAPPNGPGPSVDPVMGPSRGTRPDRRLR